ncbi:MAG: Phage protein, partial [Mucilaginibacter sp.]|nr:Phage protein [Mucilaginibacter sp.]
MSKKITHEGTLDLNGLEIPCFVLDDGTRVLSGRSLQEALKIRERPEDGEKRGGYILPTFLGSKALKPFIENKLDMAKLNPIICYRGNQKVHGYEATVLADICDAMLEARKEGVKLTERQQ